MTLADIAGVTRRPPHAPPTWYWFPVAVIVAWTFLRVFVLVELGQ